MAGLNHEFLVIENGSFSLDRYEELQEIDRVEIHDDLLNYFSDSISWVSTYNPSKKEGTSGLCLYGRTVIPPESVGKFESIMSGLLLILSEAPDIFELKGSWCRTEGDSADSGSYEKLSFRKSEVITKLSKLVSYCEAVKASGSTKCLLHLGI